MKSFRRFIFITVFVLIASLLVFGISCAPVLPQAATLETSKASEPAEGPAAPDTETAEEAKATETNATQPASKCSNSYYPIKEDATWNYKIETEGTEDTYYSISYTEVSENSFIQVISVEGATIEVSWTCDENNLVQNEYQTLTFSDMGFGEITYKTLSVEGITFPPDSEMVVGKTWNTTYKTRANIKMEDTETQADIDITTENEIVSVDSIDVPAGNYPEALNVKGKTTITASIPFGDITVNADSSTWLVKNVGMVKVEATAMNYASVMELQSLDSG